MKFFIEIGAVFILLIFGLLGFIYWDQQSTEAEAAQVCHAIKAFEGKELPELAAYLDKHQIKYQQFFSINDQDTRISLTYHKRIALLGKFRCSAFTQPQSQIIQEVTDLRFYD